MEVLDCPLQDAGGTPAVVYTDGLEIAELFGKGGEVGCVDG